MAASNRKKAKDRVGILVLGMHRSGTSVLTRVLNLLGCDLPETLMGPSKNNPTGYWESEAVRSFNDELLESAGSSWDDWTPFNEAWYDSPRASAFTERAVELLKSEFGDSPLFVLKDPRISRFAPFWLNALKEFQAEPISILTVRNPIEIAESLNRRNGLEPGSGMLIWLRHILDAERQTRGQRRGFSSYGSLLEDWRGTIDRIQEATDFRFPRLSAKTAEQINEHIDEKHRHHNVSSSRLLENSGASPWLRDVYAILKRWVEEGEDQKDHVELDQIREDFEAAIPAFVTSVETGRRAVGLSRRLEKEKGELEGELSRLNQEKSEAESERTRAKQEMERLEAELKTLSEQEKKAEKASEELKARLKSETESLRSELASVTAKHREAETSAKELEARLERETGRFEKDLEEVRNRETDALGKVDSLQKKLDEVEEKYSDRQREIEEVRYELASVTAKWEAAEVSAEELKKRLERETARFEQDLDRARSREDEAIGKADRLQAQLDEAEERYSLRQREIERLESDIASMNARREQAEKSAEELRARLKDETGRLESELEKARKHGASAKNEADTLRRELDESRTKVEEMSRELATAQDVLAQVRSELLQRSLEAEETSNELAQARQDLSEWETALSERDARIEELEQVREDLQREGRDRETRLQEMADELGEARKSKARLENDFAEEFDAVAATNERMRAQLDKLTAQTATLEKTLAKATEDNKRLKTLSEKKELEEAARAEEVEAARRETQLVLAAALERAAYGGALSRIPFLDRFGWGRRLIARSRAARLRRSGLFDEHEYLENHPDVRSANIDPALHYVLYGWKEDRHLGLARARPRRRPA